MPPRLPLRFSVSSTGVSAKEAGGAPGEAPKRCARPARRWRRAGELPARPSCRCGCLLGQSVSRSRIGCFANSNPSERVGKSPGNLWAATM
eukprot:6470607-Amphidinium_carterae.1